MAKYRDDERKRAPFRKSKTTTRTLIKKSGKVPEGAKTGFVTITIGQTSVVKEYDKPLLNIDFDKEKIDLIEGLFECIAGGTIITSHENSTLVCVGDFVYFTVSKGYGAVGLPKGVIHKVRERKSELARRAVSKGPEEQIIAANASHILIFSSAFDPMYNKRLIDRFIVAAEQGGLEPVICINKMDLVETPEVFQEDLAAYKKLDIPVFLISVLENEGIDELRDFLRGKPTILIGPSGTGKSSLINLLIGEDVQKIQEISERTGKGQHTTTFVKMFSMKEGGIIIDSPGIREFGLVGMDRQELSLYFHEFDPYFPECQYVQCSHIHEPGCAVIEAVENEQIDPERYESYIYLYNTIEDETY